MALHGLNPHSVMGRIIRASNRARGYIAGRTLGWIAPINDFERRVTSQNGEDGIIAEIFRRIGTTNRFFVEFGVEDGSQCNTAQLALAGWSGLMIEADPVLYAQLAQRCANRANLRTACSFITAENIAATFAAHGVPNELDLLSVDIDGNDYWVWRALAEYRPRVAIVEYNAAYVPPRRWVMQYSPHHRWDGTSYQGASLASLEVLGIELGYSLIGTESSGVNAFFVRTDLLRLARFRRLRAGKAYHPLRHVGRHGALGHPQRDGPYLEI